MQLGRRGFFAGAAGIAANAAMPDLRAEERFAA
jgi:hypothetical protein